MPSRHLIKEWKGESRVKIPAATLDLGLPDDYPIDPDPLDPHPEHPTPIELVLRLTASERETRVAALERMAFNRLDEAVDRLEKDGKRIASFAVMNSGGDDSGTVAALFEDVATHWVHANTETGIEKTRQHVRDTARQRGIPLIERRPKPGEGYFDLVRGNVWALSRPTQARIKEEGLFGRALQEAIAEGLIEFEQSWPGGFPGPAAHAVMQTRLKARAIEQVPHALGISGSRVDRALLIAGRRRAESKTRRTIPHYESDGSVKTLEWSSPIAVWHKADLRAYRLRRAKQGKPVPSNPVAQVLGMSGECGCLANATAEEPQRWFDAYPDDPWLLEVKAVQEEIKDREDIPLHMRFWGWNGLPETPERVLQEEARKMRELGLGSRAGDLCSPNCGTDPIFDMMDPLFEEA